MQKLKKKRLYFEDDEFSDTRHSEKFKRFEKKKTEINTKNTIVIPDDVKKVLDTLGFKIGDKVKHKKIWFRCHQKMDAKKIYVQYVDETREIGYYTSQINF